MLFQTSAGLFQANPEETQEEPIVSVFTPEESQNVSPQKRAKCFISLRLMKTYFVREAQDKVLRHANAFSLFLVKFSPQKHCQEYKQYPQII